MAKKEKIRVQTPVGRVSFQYLHKPRTEDTEGKEMDTPRYEVTLIFRPDDFTDKEAAQYKKMRQVATQTMKSFPKWGGSKPEGFRTPFRDGVEKSHLDGYGEGTVFVKFWSNYAPGIIDQRKNAITDPERVYAGGYARVTGSPFPYDKAGNKGVAFNLDNFQWAGEGEPFSTAPKADDDFEELESDELDEMDDDGVDDQHDDDDDEL